MGFLVYNKFLEPISQVLHTAFLLSNSKQTEHSDLFYSNTKRFLVIPNLPISENDAKLSHNRSLDKYLQQLESRAPTRERHCTKKSDSSDGDIRGLVCLLVHHLPSFVFTYGELNTTIGGWW